MPPGAEDLYETPRPGAHTAGVYEHAARALDHSLAFGRHGLPLMGAGDWNDGMNRVGIEGKGESVWLAWFQLTLLEPMAQLADGRCDATRATRWRAAAQVLRDAVQHAGWDRAWYRRAYFDDGSPLGSATAEECRIDLIAQAWAVLAQPPGPQETARAQQAMQSAAAHLFDDDAELLRLLHPPLQHQRPAAGYIQAYPPGVRENGGQYNHAAVWAAMAFAQLGDARLAWRAWCCVSPVHRHERDRRADLPAGVRGYGLEPWAVAGDVYADAPWKGRGGWSWYTGAAGWLYRTAVESIVGLRREGSRVRFEPVLPPHWPHASVSVRWGAHVHRFHLGPAVEPRPRMLARGEWVDLAREQGDTDWALRVPPALPVDRPREPQATEAGS